MIATMVAAMAQDGARKVEAQRHCSRVVVRRTFVELVDDPASASDQDFLANSSLRCRAQSDPALYEKSLQLWGSSYLDGSADPHEVEFELAGLSDGEGSDSETEASGSGGAPRSATSAAERTDVDGARTRGTKSAAGVDEGEELLCWSDTVTEQDVDEHSTFLCCQHSSVPHSVAVRSQRGARRRHGSSPAVSICSGDEFVAGRRPVDVEEPDRGGVLQEMARLWRDNARLALENQLLRENARLVSENAVMVSGAPLPAGNDERQPETGNQQHRPAVPPGTWSRAGGQGDASGMPHYAWGVHIGPGMWHSPVKAVEAAQAKAPVASARRRRRRKCNTGANPAAETDDCKGEVSAEDGGDRRTTVMLRNLPNDYSRQMFLDMLDAEGFAGLYDFIYLPIDFKTQACLGYAFVNLLGPEVVAAFWSKFDRYADWVVPSRKIGKVTWSGPHQGWAAHVGRYRDSPVMHPSVPEAYKPLVFVDGVVADFPAPTKSPKAPRSRYMVLAASQEVDA